MAELDTGYPVWPVASMPRRLQTRPARLPPASSPIPSRFQPLFRNKSVTGHSHMFFSSHAPVGVPENAQESGKKDAKLILNRVAIRRQS